MDEEKLQATLTTLLQKAEDAEEIIEDEGYAKSGAVTFNEFESVLEKLELNCTSEESRVVFDEMDKEGAGVLSPRGWKKRIRESGAIAEMYQSGLTGVVLTLLPTAALAAGFYYFKGQDSALDFIAGYVVEDSLSVDNLFVFLLLFKYFKVPPSLQKFCLDVGIVGAVVLRGVFIFGGLALIQSFRPFLLLFSAFLIYSSYAALTSDDDDDDEEEKPPDLVEQALSFLPTSPKFDGDKLVVQGPNGNWLATPLALCIIAVELSDILFAVDSVPAIFAITDDPLVIYTSNIAAILGLRALYQVLAVAVQDLAYLDKAVAVVLGLVGVKLGLEVFEFEIDSVTSLVVILSTLGVGIAASLLEQGKDDEDEDEGPKPAAAVPVSEEVREPVMAGAAAPAAEASAVAASAPAPAPAPEPTKDSQYPSYWPDQLKPKQ